MHDGIGELLDEGTAAPGAGQASGLLAQFYNSPLINPLFKGAYQARSGKLPSYIPSASFAAAVMHLVGQGATLPEPLGSAVKRLSAGAPAEASTAQAQLEAWYDSAMDRVSGRYKRHTQAWLVGLGFAIAAIGNINPIAIGDRLASDQQLRAGITALGTTYASGTTPPATGAAVSELATKMQTQLQAAGLPIGWDKGCDGPGKVWHGDAACYPTGGSLVQSLGGWLLAALAAMLGAPFWFDILSKLVNIRAAIKPGTPASTDRAVSAAGGPTIET